jgi:tetratricopeptide (TPR) repeat protein
MYMARREPPERKSAGRRAGRPDRKAVRQGTLERRYDFHLGEAIRASLTESHEKAATHSERALAISRELYAGTPEPARPGLAAALANHARYGGIRHAITLLAESAGHYAALADADPEAYEVLRIDVLARVALAADASGSTGGAISLLREVIRMYEKAPAADQAQRDLSLAGAHFYLGRCLLKTGAEADGLAETDVGLDLAEQTVELLRMTDGGAQDRDGPGDDPAHWLCDAPRSVQAIAPDWLAAAIRSMTLHSAAGRWGQAARAARTAIRVSAGLAALGGDVRRQAHEALLARANIVAYSSAGPSAST